MQIYAARLVLVHERVVIEPELELPSVLILVGVRVEYLRQGELRDLKYCVRLDYHKVDVRAGRGRLRIAPSGFAVV